MRIPVREGENTRMARIEEVVMSYGFPGQLLNPNYSDLEGHGIRKGAWKT